MLKRTLISAAVAMISCTAPVAWAADPQPDPKQVSSTEQVYGNQLMTPEERIEFRNKMRAAKTPQEREAIRAEHHTKMQARAKEKGVTLPDAPPAGGMGGGMGPGMGGGMGPGPRR